MSFIRWILALPIIVGAVLFALANPQIVSITWNPFDEAAMLPLYFVSLSFLGAGFILGAFICWLGMGKVRQERRQQKKTIKALEKEINDANEKMTEALSKYKPGSQNVIDHMDENDD